MAACKHCDQEMLDNAGCTLENYDDFADGIKRPRIKYGDEVRPFESDPCHDCGAPKGTYHHPGCDAEECPSCGGQAFICDCIDAFRS